MNDTTWKNNIEGIMNKIKEESKLTTLFKKFDGITIECRVPVDCDREKAIQEMECILTKEGLVPYNIERNKEVQNAYVVQFPELDIIYTNEEKVKAYKTIFKFLLDNINQNRDNPVSKSSVIESREIYIKQTIQAFHRSHINRYKIGVADLLNDLDYRKHLERLFLDYVDEYMDSKALSE